MIQIPLQSIKLKDLRCLRENYRKPILTQRKNHPAHGFPTKDLFYASLLFRLRGIVACPGIIHDHYEALLTKYMIIVPMATFGSSAADKMSDIRDVRK